MEQIKGIMTEMLEQASSWKMRALYRNKLFHESDADMAPVVAIKAMDSFGPRSWKFNPTVATIQKALQQLDREAFLNKLTGIEDSKHHKPNFSVQTCRRHGQ